MTNTSDREKKLQEVDKKLEDFSSRVKAMYVVNEDVKGITEEYFSECENLKHTEDEFMRKKLFDGAYFAMVDKICKVIEQADIDIQCLDILKNVMYEDDKVDGKTMAMVFTCWSKVNARKYPMEALAVSKFVLDVLND
jgi:hypothetical protein